MKPAAYRWNIAALSALSPDTEPAGPYSGFAQIDGTHPWKYAVPNGFIEYEARILRGSKVVFFNFSLAKEMGLIEKNHPHQLTKALERALVETFALRIINEHDQLMGERPHGRDLKSNRYMATRYLQLQHDCKRGFTSGDGRSIWNGQHLAPTGIAWDISSCGTGTTRLSPAAAMHGKPVRTGDPAASYGSGLADVDEGLIAALQSEGFHARGLLTERTLVILETPDGDGINVRSAPNLLRPSHLFLHLKQSNQLMLKRSLDFYITKQMHNEEWTLPKEAEKYDYFLSRLAQQYGEFAARLEDEYIFCWLDWDGDNMLLGGGIIDYGSIRQFGLCHHRYRYDDVERLSTNLKEQWHKARYLVQTFVQLVDFVRSGHKRHLRAFAGSPLLAQFERSYRATIADCILKRIGLSRAQRKKVRQEHPRLVENFIASYRYFERKESSRGLRRTPDGLNNPPLFCLRTLLRELPRRMLLEEQELQAAAFIEIMRTPFLTKKEERRLSQQTNAPKRFQSLYLDLVRAAHKGKPLRRALLETAMRASQSNRTGYVTGDGIIHVVERLLAQRKSLSRNEFQRLLEAFLLSQQGKPATLPLRERTKRILHSLFLITEKNRFSI